MSDLPPKRTTAAAPRPDRCCTRPATPVIRKFVAEHGDPRTWNRETWHAYLDLGGAS